MAGTAASATLAKASAARTLSSSDPMPIVPGATSASAIRAIDEPITRASCNAVSTSVAPSRTIPKNSWTASMSRSVKARSPSPTSAKPRARQKRRTRSNGRPVSSATSRWV